MCARACRHCTAQACSPSLQPRKLAGDLMAAVLVLSRKHQTLRLHSIQDQALGQSGKADFPLVRGRAGSSGRVLCHPRVKRKTGIRKIIPATQLYYLLYGIIYYTVLYLYSVLSHPASFDYRYLGRQTRTGVASAPKAIDR